MEENAEIKKHERFQIGENLVKEEIIYVDFLN